MFRWSLILAALGLSAAAALLAPAGCASNIDRDELRERQRWIDDKGRYRADWRYSKYAPPPGYPKSLPK